MVIGRLLHTVVGLLAISAGLAIPKTAQAGLLTLNISQGMASTQVVDGGVGDLDGLVNNIIVAQGNVGDWQYNLSTNTNGTPASPGTQPWQA